jgi:hypothetical protein
MGLDGMGHMLAHKMERNGFRVAGYDLDLGKVQAFAGAGDTTMATVDQVKAFAKGGADSAVGSHRFPAPIPFDLREHPRSKWQGLALFFYRPRLLRFC